ncbi:hypothetical protein CPB86DRAFT_798356 [Serendipita vermifera]|nr:hypothetical protein CPB86DRAFT_798356 [Serendipita vermifera]
MPLLGCSGITGLVVLDPAPSILKEEASNTWVKQECRHSRPNIGSSSERVATDLDLNRAKCVTCIETRQRLGSTQSGSVLVYPPPRCISTFECIDHRAVRDEGPLTPDHVSY